jgi:hypothetical protein
VIGVTMLMLNNAQTHYTKQGFPRNVALDVPGDAPKEKPGKPYDRDQESFSEGEGKTNPGWKADTTEYRVAHVREERDGLKPGRYLVDEGNKPVYRADVPIARDAKKMDNGEDAPPKFDAPQPRLFADIIKGILGGKLEWGLVIAGALMAIALEMCGVSALPVAVGMYLSLASSMPIFIGGMVRLVADRLRGAHKSEAEAETSPGVLLASGYIAGGTLCGLLVLTFTEFFEPLKRALNVGFQLFAELNPKTNKMEWKPDESDPAKVAAVVMFGLLGAFLLWIGSRKDTLPPKPAPPPPAP